VCSVFEDQDVIIEGVGYYSYASVVIHVLIGYCPLDISQIDAHHLRMMRGIKYWCDFNNWILLLFHN